MLAGPGRVVASCSTDPCGDERGDTSIAKWRASLTRVAAIDNFAWGVQ